MKVHEYKAQLDALRLPIVRETAQYNADGRKDFSSPAAIYDFCCADLRLQDCVEEYVYIFCLDSKNKLTALFEAGHGTACASVVDGRGIFQKMLLLNTLRFIVVHNHPSGNTTPSQEDIVTTEKLIGAAKLLGLAFLDHVIIGDGTYCSIREENVVAF